MSEIYLDREGADTCIEAIKVAIEALRSAASDIDGSMGQLREVWRGTSASKCQGTYENDYKNMLTTQIPDAVEELKAFVDSCVQAIYDTDNSL